MYLARRKGLGSDQVRSIAMSPRRAGARLTCSVSPGRPRSSFGGELWATRGAVAMLSFLPSVTTRRCSSIVSVWICRVSSVFVFRSSSETGHPSDGSAGPARSSTSRLEEIRRSIGSVGDACDNALMESIKRPHKAECIRTTVFHNGPYKTVADVDYSTAGWVD